MNVFRSDYAEELFQRKYAHEGCETWEKLAWTTAHDICSGLLPKDTVEYIYRCIASMKFIPGGRYLYYAGRQAKYVNNCYLFKSTEDTREGWADLAQKATSALMSGGGIGNDYSVFRPEGSYLSRTGGVASGPIPLMEMVNEIGNRVMQGGSRRSAIYASLAREHGDIWKFLAAKDWDNQFVLLPGHGMGMVSVGALRRTAMAASVAEWGDDSIVTPFQAPLDSTNISVNYGDEWLHTFNRHLDPVFLENCGMACRNGEPGMSFNFGSHAGETGRNACAEVVSSDDSDVCNIGSLNMSRIHSPEEFKQITEVATAFLLCGTIKGMVPFDAVQEIREKNRRLGLGLMGMQEWLAVRDYDYSVTPELHSWLKVYASASDASAKHWSAKLGVNEPVAKRAIAPTGTIGSVAATTTGIEPVIAKAYKRRVLNGKDSYDEFNVIDPTIKHLHETQGIEAVHKLETAKDLAKDPYKRLKFQADVQDYVDNAISSTLNLPPWGSEFNNEDTVESFAKTLSDFAPRLRGFTCYPDGARGGQPYTEIDVDYALANPGKVREEALDVCVLSGKGGSCGE